MKDHSGSPSATAEDCLYQSGKLDPFALDIEQKAMDDSHLMNDTVRNFGWQGITVFVKDRKTKERKAILENVEGFVKAGTALIS